MLKGICFDMDGTMCDSDDLHFQAYRDTILRLVPTFQNGKPIERSWYNTWMSGNSNAVITSRLFPDMPLSEQEDMWVQKEELYRSISTSMVPLAGLKRVLNWCDESGVKTIVVTNAPRIDALHTLEVLGFSERFAANVVIGNECANSKPQPDPYLEGLRRLNLDAKDCIAFEDSINGISAARQAGLFTFGMITGLEKEMLLSAGACLAIENFDDPVLWDFLKLHPSDKTA